ncbi:MAG TPA: hypothetical protein VH165_31390 [Kofleriaceae bacterium]|jgi:uncharacterized membrane protein|nr:hypothetical protein [Kofleriaceae bacterium]
MSNKPVIADEPTPGLSFKEKSLWVTAASILAIYGYYFWRAVELGDGHPGELGVLFAGVVIVMIIVQAVVHAALAIHQRPERTDERDRQVAQKAARNAYYVLVSGVWGALGVAALSLGTFWCAHAALLAIVIAELVHCGSQLVYYRRGA